MLFGTTGGNPTPVSHGSIVKDQDSPEPPCGPSAAQDPDRPAPAAEREARLARRARRRAQARRVLDTSVPSPCVSICQTDPRDDTCIGCARHIDEIRDWPILSAEEKQAILAQLPDRKAAKA